MLYLDRGTHFSTLPHKNLKIEISSCLLQAEIYGDLSFDSPSDRVANVKRSQEKFVIKFQRILVDTLIRKLCLPTHPVKYYYQNYSRPSQHQVQ